MVRNSRSVFARYKRQRCRKAFTVEGISGDEFTGTMEWPTFNDCKTIVQGFLDGERIVWSETAYLKGEE